LSGVFFAVSAAILTPYVIKFFNLKVPSTHVNLEDIEIPLGRNDDNLESWRKNNRLSFEDFSSRVLLFVTSFYAMFVATYVPISLQGGILESSLDLNFTRLHIDYILLGDSYYLASIILASLLYLPCFYLSTKIANLVTRLIYKYRHTSKKQYRSFVFLSMVFLALVIAGQVVFILNPGSSWIDSMLIVFILIFFFLLMIISPRR